MAARVEMQFQVAEREIDFCEWCVLNLNYAPIFLKNLKLNYRFDIEPNLDYLPYEIELPKIDDD